ncbi:MAG: AraC family transcriptional regulator [Bacteroidetes bacterium]|nr:AraC family transcriptional regulator [Bacteroidota bacterium]
MVCSCCIRVIREEFAKAGIGIVRISLGIIEIEYDPKKMNLDIIAEILKSNGFGIVLDREKRIVENIKLAVIELIHYLNNVDSIVRKSEYLVEKLGMTYHHLSKVFSMNESITLEKYIILNKIERTKELIDSNDFTLSEIAYMMDYSSVQYLSNQFRKITGMSVSDYKKSDKSSRRPLTDLY